MRVTVRNLRKVVTAIYLNRVRCLFPANCVATITVDESGLNALRSNRAFRVENVIDDKVTEEKSVSSDEKLTVEEQKVEENKDIASEQVENVTDNIFEQTVETEDVPEEKTYNTEVTYNEPLPKNLDQMNRQALTELCVLRNIPCDDMTRKQMIAALKR